MDSENGLTSSAQKIRHDIIDIFKLTNEKMVVFVAFINYPLLNNVSLYKNSEFYGACNWLGRALSKNCELDNFLFDVDFPVTKHDLTKHQWQIEFTVL